MEKHVRWLYEELPQWVAEGIVPAESQARLHARYGEVTESKYNWASMIWISLAAILMAVGVVLLLSERWYDIARDTRFWMAMGMVGLSQLGAVVASLWVKKEVWREAAGIFHGVVWTGAMLAAGSMYSLNMDATWKLFLVMAICLLPVVYVLRSVLLASWYALLVAMYVSQSGTVNAWFGEQSAWLLLLAAAPFFYILYRDASREKSLLLYGWCYTVAMYIVYFVTSASYLVTTPVFFAILSVLTLLFGGTIGRGKLWGAPFRIIGGVTTVASMLHATWWTTWNVSKVALMPMIMAVLLLFLLGAIGWRLYRRRRYEWVVLILHPFLTTFAAVTGAGSGTTSLRAIAIVMMAYYIGATIWVLFKGIRQGSMLWIDSGLLMTAAFITVRLLDDTFTYWERGIAFFVLGGAVLVMHVILSRHQRKQMLPRRRESAARNISEKVVDKSVASVESISEREADEVRPKDVRLQAKPFVPSERSVPKVVVPTRPRGLKQESQEKSEIESKGADRLSWQRPPQREMPQLGVKEEHHHEHES